LNSAGTFVFVSAHFVQKLSMNSIINANLFQMGNELLRTV
jgi:hypothetical protein